MSFIGKAINNIVDKFSQDIEMHLSPAMVSFHRGINFIQSAPVIYISDTERPPKILAVGDAFTPKESYLKINVLNFDEISNKTDFDQMDLLIPFFSYCVSRVIGSATLIRPKVIIHKFDSLDGLLNDNDKKIIENALLEIGARGCVFK